MDFLVKPYLNNSIMNRNNNHAQVWAVKILLVDDNAYIENHFGENRIMVSGPWCDMLHSSVELTCDDNQATGAAALDLKIKIADSSDVMQALCRALSSRPVVVSVSYTNLETKVIGTDTSPLYLSYSIGGNPRTITLSYKGDLPERPKDLSSF